jgi:transposase
VRKNGNSSQALLLANEGLIDEMIADLIGMHRRGIEELRQRFVKDGFEVTLEGKPRGLRPRALTGEDQARLIALVCGPVPEGCARCTLKLLEDTWVTLENTDTKTVSRETTRQALKKTRLMPMAETRMVYSPSQGKRGVCSRDGGCP